MTNLCAPEIFWGRGRQGIYRRMERILDRLQTMLAECYTTVCSRFSCFEVKCQKVTRYAEFFYAQLLIDRGFIVCTWTDSITRKVHARRIYVALYGW